MINIHQLQTKIAPTQLLAVTKKRSVPEIRELIAFGIKYIGENTLQEIQKKYDNELLTELKNKGVELHYIGDLQTNKIKRIVKICDGIHSVDSIDKAGKVNKAAAELNKIMSIFLELNLTGEEQKHGIHETGLELINIISQVRKFSNLKLLGFMTIGKHDDQVQTREIFRACKQLSDSFGLPEVSMGMTDDYKIALEEGSTMLRLGRMLFEMP